MLYNVIKYLYIKYVCHKVLYINTLNVVYYMLICYKISIFEIMYMDEPNGEPYLNLIGKFNFEPNFILVEPKPSS